MIRHKKPISTEPTKLLAENIDLLLNAPCGPVVDVACGYGRNGCVFAGFGREVHFVDIDSAAIRFVRDFIDGVCKQMKVENRSRLLCVNLERERWPYEKCSVAGVIMVHYYQQKVVEAALRSIKAGGFFLFESVGDHGSNYLELPGYGRMKRALGEFSTVFFYERRSTKNTRRAVVKVLAIKK